MYTIMKNGNLSINSENIFPVIKKWLYSDHDIFVRELISNGCDAVTKLKKLSLMGEFDEPDEPYRIDVTTSANDKTITFTDNGIGMTEEEVEKYINQIAFSGAEAFLAVQGQGNRGTDHRPLRTGRLLRIHGCRQGHHRDKVIQGRRGRCILGVRGRP